MQALIAWAQQPSSVAGLATLFGTISAVMAHQITWAQACPLVGGALVSIAVPDNTRAKSDAEALVRDLVSPAAKQDVALAPAQPATANRP